MSPLAAGSAYDQTPRLPHYRAFQAASFFPHHKGLLEYKLTTFCRTVHCRFTSASLNSSFTFLAGMELEAWAVRGIPPASPCMIVAVSNSHSSTCQGESFTDYTIPKSTRLNSRAVCLADWCNRQLLGKVVVAGQHACTLTSFALSSYHNARCISQQCAVVM